ncbi:MAG: drug:proton antiporter [Symbiopectobacterium sp.]|uniref:drug:proton antiporter n=1 Tax=Symbiopectobacterium sp. TaxID=2952789 RepID=UPI0039EB85FA
MLSADISIPYVSNVMKSSDFYAQLFDINPVEKSPTFALFVFENGFKLGLWSCYTVEPGINQIASIPSGEIVFTVQNKPEIDALYQTWGDSSSGHRDPKTCLARLWLFLCRSRS